MPKYRVVKPLIPERAGPPQREPFVAVVKQTVCSFVVVILVY